MRSWRGDGDMRKQVLQQDRAVSGITNSIRAAKKRLDRWPLQKRRWKAIEGGLLRVYRQARDAMKTARAKPDDDESLHEWRKRTKDLRYEVKLLEPAWPQTLKPLADQAHQLTDLLGEDHDLAVLKTVATDQARQKSSGNTDADTTPMPTLSFCLP